MVLNLLYSLLFINADIMPLPVIDNCITSAGYSWCESSHSCIRQWETPCSDNFSDCSDCLERQRMGENIACPIECDRLTDSREPASDCYTDGIPSTEILCDKNQISECSIPYTECDFEYVCPKVMEITQCSEGGIAGHTTYRLSLVINNQSVKNIYAMYGDNYPELNPMTFPPAYQGGSIFNNNIGGISSEIIAINNDAAYDSWLTIGIIDGDPLNQLSTIGIDFNSWNENNGIYTTNGAVYIMNPNQIVINDNEYIIAQLTIPNDIVKDVLINVQGKLNCNGCQPDTWTQKNIEFHISRPILTSSNIIPQSCVTWYDGCNTCSVNNGILGSCTKIMCFIDDTPECREYNTGH